MPKIEYVSKKFSASTLAIIKDAEAIIAEYQAQGFSLTLRQLYYQFVARDLIPNTEQSYKRIGSIISDARRAGLIDWSAIVDRTRALRKLSFWSSPYDMLVSARDSYHRDLWATQDLRMEVWIEKDALIGVIQKVCQDNDVPFFSCRGYVSDSEMWAGAVREIQHRESDQNVIILHLGDHDPSGIDMTRDITERLDLFSFRGDIEVRRIALTMEQVEELGPPPNPAKITDSRYDSYAALYGNESWELDALEPQYIANLIGEHILAERDDDRWQVAVQEQEDERAQLTNLLDRWNELFGESEEA